MNFEGSKLQKSSMRLVTQNGIVIRSCTWPTRFEAPHTGTYTIKTQMSAFKPDDKEALVVELLVVKPSVTFTKIPPLRRAATFKVPADGRRHELSAEFDLEKGQTVAFYWANAPLGKDGTKELEKILLKYPKMYAAWGKIGGYERGRLPEKTWELLKNAMASEDLDENLVQNPKDFVP